MFRCYICRALHNAPSTLIQHFKFFHGLYPGRKFVLVCAQEQCSLQYNSFKGFRMNLNSCHKTVHMDTSSDVLQTSHQSIPSVSAQSSQEDASEMDLDVINQPSTSHMSKEQAKDMCASIIAKLQGSGVANSVVLSVVESMEEYVDEVHASLKGQMLSAVPPDNPCRDAVEEVFSNTFNPFSDLNTNCKMNK